MKKADLNFIKHCFEKRISVSTVHKVLSPDITLKAIFKQYISWIDDDAVSDYYNLSLLAVNKKYGNHNKVYAIVNKYGLPTKHELSRVNINRKNKVFKLAKYFDECINLKELSKKVNLHYTTLCKYKKQYDKLKEEGVL